MPLSLPKRVVRRVLHEAVYRFVIKPSRTKTLYTRAAGFRFVVRPTVFHPKYFLSSEIFAAFVGRLDLRGKRVVDVGTGSGVIALAASRAGAEHVVALDVNPEAVRCAMENARSNGLDKRMSAVCSDLLSAISPDASFDVILTNPPFFSGEPRDLADRAWHAGPKLRDVSALFRQARQRLSSDGRMYVVLSSDADPAAWESLFADAGFTATVKVEKRLLFESMLVFELRA